MDALPLESNTSGGTWANSHPDEDDIVRTAAAEFIAECFEELASILDCDVRDLQREAEESLGADAEVAPEAEPTPEVAAADDRAASEEEQDTEVTQSEDEMRDELAALQKQQEEAMEAEDFDECDRLQTRISVLEEKLA